MKCIYCEEETEQNTNACNNCLVLEMVIERSKPSVVEKVIRQIHLAKFMAEKAK